MPIIEIQRVPGLPKERVKVREGVIFSDWLSESVLHSDVRVNVNGKELQDDDEVGFAIASDDRIIIYDQPKNGGLVGTLLNPLEHFNPIKFTQKVLSSLIRQPNVNAAAGNSKTSPNNSLKGQTNIARNGEARPDNFGLIRSFPDLIQQSIFEYVNNNKKVTEWMNFGLGRYDVSSVRYSESNLGALAGASYEVFQPGENIPRIEEAFTFDDVDGQELPGPNESDDFPAETATTTSVTSGSFLAGQAKVTIPRNDTFNYFYDLAKPHSVTFIVNVTYNTVSGSVTKDITLYGDLLEATTTDNGALVDPVYFYNFTFGNLSGKDYDETPAEAIVNNTIFTLNDNEPLTVGPFFSPVVGSELWVHLQSQLGHGDGDYAVAEITFWKVDDDNVQIPGTSETFTRRQENFTGRSDTFYDTFKFLPLAGEGRYAVEIKRTNTSSDHSIMKIEMIHIVRQRINVTYPNDTIVTITVQATEQATSSRDRKYNALINRHVISYNISTQAVDYTLRASRKFADIAIFNWLVIGGQPETTIDIYGLYEIQARIDAIDERLGYCDYTFDDEDVSLGSRMETICDAACVSVYWDDGVLSFTLDEKRDKPVTVFNRTNTKSDGYSLTYDMSLPGDYDGVEIQYRNPTTNKQDYIRYRVRNGGVELGQPVKAKKFEKLYIRNAFQADYRARRECLRLIYSRMNSAITALADGEWVNVGDMVQIPDAYDINQQSGYIISRTGNKFETSERINFSGEMFVVVTDYLGNPSARYAATPIADTAFGFIASVPNIQINIFDGYDVQSPSRYYIATTTEMNSTLWVITEKKPNSDGTTELKLAEYSDLIYQ